MPSHSCLAIFTSGNVLPNVDAGFLKRITEPVSKLSGRCFSLIYRLTSLRIVVVHL